MADQEYEDSFTSERSSDEDNQQANSLSLSDEHGQSTGEKSWLNCQFHDKERQQIKKPDEIENNIEDPSFHLDQKLYNRIQGSIFGMAVGDALGAHVEFRPRQYLVEKPVQDLEGGGTWGLQKGQFTDDTSMALCLANSLIYCEGFNPYDQLVRYNWWHHHGYMSSTGICFDIGAATKQALDEFVRRQRLFAQENQISADRLDFLRDQDLLRKFDIYCSEDGVAGNGALMRLAPVPLFFYRDPVRAVEYSGISGQMTHGDQKAYDACRYYGALIVAALHGESKEKLLDENFYLTHRSWFGDKELHPDVLSISQGSFKKAGGYEEGIRGKGYIIPALEAALWAFWSDGDSFHTGVLNAVNLGDDTDTTAAIYGQLAGAYYTYQNLPAQWIEQIYAKKFLHLICKWITHLSEERHIFNYEPIHLPKPKPVRPPAPAEKDSPVPVDLPNGSHDDPYVSTTSYVDLKQRDDDNDKARENTSTFTHPYGQQIYQNIHYDRNDSEDQQETTSDRSEEKAEIPTKENRPSELFKREFFSYRREQDPSTTRAFRPIQNQIENSSVNIPITVTKRREDNHSSTTHQPASPSKIISIEKHVEQRGQTTYPSSAQKPFSPKKMLMSWTVDDVCQWVQSFGDDYSNYVHAFRKDHTDGFRLISFINQNVLLEFGVRNSKHQQTLLDAIQQLRQRSSHASRFYSYSNY